MLAGCLDLSKYCDCHRSLLLEGLRLLFDGCIGDLELCCELSLLRTCMGNSCLELLLCILFFLHVSIQQGLRGEELPRAELVAECVLLHVACENTHAQPARCATMTQDSRCNTQTNPRVQEIPWMALTPRTTGCKYDSLTTASLTREMTLAVCVRENVYYDSHQ